jgi:division protein CdvB (Snf7/Vps24/ESCRT-III family)
VDAFLRLVATEYEGALNALFSAIGTNHSLAEAARDRERALAALAQAMQESEKLAASIERLQEALSGLDHHPILFLN